tara:strand:- start:1311 stop:2231 length:921 start_codon:yes stop_codon:yes gene_type:complete
MFIYFLLLLLSINKYFLLSEKNILSRYGKNSWVIITGGSSGQGKQFCLEFAKRGFNIFIIGSKRILNVEKEINSKYPRIQTKTMIKNFSEAYQKNFFEPIKYEIKKISNVSILINNIGHRTGWNPYHEMPEDKINDTIICGTIVQSRLIRLVLPYMLERRKKSAIINITAQCMHPNIGIGVGLSNEISLPYLSVYEAANAFGFYHANSLYKEYKDKIDFLNITPGAVVTENTKYLEKTIFSVNSNKFVNNIIKFLGNVNGTTCAYWGHGFTLILINFFPFIKNRILTNVGDTISKEYMENFNLKKY